jgi:hypothetical protein
MSRLRPGLLGTLVVLCAWALGPWGLEARAQGLQEPELVTIELRTTAASGRSLYVDKGRDDGLEPGDRVRFFVPGQAGVEGEVRSVSSSSARVELFGEARVDSGLSGEARVPAARLEALRAALTDEVAAPPADEHPPWTRPPEAWSEGLPLLAPLEEIEPEDRETTVRGRAFAQLDHTWDEEGAGSRSLFARVGADLRIENPFERGGLLKVDAEGVRRMSSFADGAPDETDDRARLQRFSYAFGGTRHDPTRFELGRFLQSGFPEFGLLDGVEVSQHQDSSSYVGIAAGLLPEPTFEQSTGDDAQLAAYVVRELGPQRDLAWRLGLQKTWHTGRSDRDLLASGLHWRLSDELSLRGSALVDYYSSNERVKSAGPELTELHLFADWRPSRRGGVSASYDRVRWPDERRQEFVALPAAELIDQRFERASLRFWGQATRDLRLSLRGDLWSNDEDDGSGGELRVDWSELLWERGRVTAAVFAHDGQYSSIEGLRLGLDREATGGRWALGYELARTDQDAFLGAQAELLRQSLRSSFDTRIGDDWSLSLAADKLFGDAQDALTVGIYLQRRF